MSLLLWATGFLSFALYLMLQQMFGISAAFSAFLTGLLLVLVAVLTGRR